eukprot:gene274-480_t
MAAASGPLTTLAGGICGDNAVTAHTDAASASLEDQQQPPPGFKHKSASALLPSASELQHHLDAAAAAPLGVDDSSPAAALFQTQQQKTPHADGPVQPGSSTTDVIHLSDFQAGSAETSAVTALDPSETALDPAAVVDFDSGVDLGQSLTSSSQQEQQDQQDAIGSTFTSWKQQRKHHDSCTAVGDGAEVGSAAGPCGPSHLVTATLATSSASADSRGLGTVLPEEVADVSDVVGRLMAAGDLAGPDFGEKCVIDRPTEDEEDDMLASRWSMQPAQSPQRATVDGESAETAGGASSGCGLAIMLGPVSVGPSTAVVSEEGSTVSAAAVVPDEAVISPLAGQQGAFSWPGQRSRSPRLPSPAAVREGSGGACETAAAAAVAAGEGAAEGLPTGSLAAQLVAATIASEERRFRAHSP